uniref:Uncharacterized protein n=1 Tax=Noctiluca scintillans TaxID=2966 RepID=A0A7S1AAV6_NOCSC
MQVSTTQKQQGWRRPCCRRSSCWAPSHTLFSHDIQHAELHDPGVDVLARPQEVTRRRLRLETANLKHHQEIVESTDSLSETRAFCTSLPLCARNRASSPVVAIAIASRTKNVTENLNTPHPM